jgi:hypothetical protein
MFKWLEFCRQHNIPFEDKGRNIYIDCPLCTNGKDKGHLGLSTDGPKWGCWKGHTGRDAWYMIKSLLRCSEVEAKRIASDGEYVDSDFGALREQFSSLGSEQEQDALESYRLPKECFKLDDSPVCDPFWKYLDDRGLDRSCALTHKIHGATSGEFSWRVVLPFYHQGQLVGATGRHIGKSTIRYHTMPANVTSRILYNSDNAELNPGDALVLVEGPFDCMILDQAFVKMNKPCVAVAMLGLNFGPSKRREVARLAQSFKRVVVLTDRKAEKHAFQIREALSASVRNVNVSLLPDYAKDPAELRLSDAKKL